LALLGACAIHSTLSSRCEKNQSTDEEKGSLSLALKACMGKEAARPFIIQSQISIAISLCPSGRRSLQGKSAAEVSMNRFNVLLVPAMI